MGVLEVVGLVVDPVGGREVAAVDSAYSAEVGSRGPLVNGDALTHGDSFSRGNPSIGCPRNPGNLRDCFRSIAGFCQAGIYGLVNGPVIVLFSICDDRAGAAGVRVRGKDGGPAGSARVRGSGLAAAPAR